MPKYRLDELDDDLELDEKYTKVQKIKRGQKRPLDQLPKKKKDSPKHSGQRPEKA